MMNQEEKILFMQKKKKRLLIAVLVIIGAFALVGIVLFIATIISTGMGDELLRESPEGSGEIRYIFPPDTDWDRNIFEESVYMSFDRAVKYSDGVALTVMTEETKEFYPPAAQFMYDVVWLIINGDYEKYNEIFADEYWENGGADYEFPMQALYNIELQIIDESESKTSADVSLSYMMYKNDGMFRSDLPYDEPALRPFVYRLIMDDEGKIKVLDKFPQTIIAGSNFE